MRQWNCCLDSGAVGDGRALTPRLRLGLVMVARAAKMLVEQVDPCVRTAVEFGEEAHWAGEIGLTLGWSSLTFRMFSRECANSLDHRRWYSYVSGLICIAKTYVVLV